WRALPRGSPQQLAERYADLAASHCEALRLREEKESDNVRLQLENTQLRRETRRLRRENRRLFQEILPGTDAVSDKPATSDLAAEAEALRVQLERLQEKHRRALQQLRRCRAAGGLAASELDELLEEEEK
ncbi:TUSC1 protein, partial [Galbula dea]|nr:TUSC1 protein [Galbula dea]